VTVKLIAPFIVAPQPVFGVTTPVSVIGMFELLTVAVTMRVQPFALVTVTV
jgi:hypothetical protein